MKKFYTTLIALFAMSAMCVAQNVWGVELVTAGTKQMAVLKVVQSELELGLKEAKDLVSAAPVILLENVAKERAETFAQKLRAEDATVELLIKIDETSFPDENFRKEVAAEYDKNTDANLSETEINAVTSMDFLGYGIADLKGIEYFTALKYLGCEDNQLTALDVSACTALKELECSFNKLTALDVSGCTALQSLLCNKNKLTTLDVSGFTALETLNCSYNQLTTLDISGCANLEEINCQMNKLSGDAMTALVNGLCDRKKEYKEGTFYVLDKSNDDEENVIYVEQVAIATGKKWRVRARDWDNRVIDYYGEVQPTAIRTVETTTRTAADSSWYSIDGKKLGGEPTQRGVYIHGGRKVNK